jgi:hypothetical protein
VFHPTRPIETPIFVALRIPTYPVVERLVPRFANVVCKTTLRNPTAKSRNVADKIGSAHLVEDVDAVL